MQTNGQETRIERGRETGTVTETQRERKGET